VDNTGVSNYASDGFGVSAAHSDGEGHVVDNPDEFGDVVGKVDHAPQNYHGTGYPQAPGSPLWQAHHHPN
jgi:hypothetical protein